MKLFLEVVGPLQENCYIVAGEKGGAVIVDPGDDADDIIALLQEQKLLPTMILLTHGHFDHIGAVGALRAAYPDVTVAAHEGDLEYLTESSAKRAGMYRMGDTQRFVVQPDLFVEDGDALETSDGLTFRVLATPGHSQGSVCYLCGDLMFSGDTLFAGDIGRCDLRGGDYETMKASLEKLKGLKEEYRVLPGHGPASLLSREKLCNPYMTGEAL